MFMRIRELRTAANMTQSDFAERVGVTQGIVSNWETETFLPKTRDLPLLARTLCCSIGDLFADGVEPDDGVDSA